jgi:hypothetical protein
MTTFPVASSIPGHIESNICGEAVYVATGAAGTVMLALILVNQFPLAIVHEVPSMKLLSTATWAVNAAHDRSSPAHRARAQWIGDVPRATGLTSVETAPDAGSMETSTVSVSPSAFDPASPHAASAAIANNAHEAR